MTSVLLVLPWSLCPCCLVCRCHVGQAMTKPAPSAAVTSALNESDDGLFHYEVVGDGVHGETSGGRAGGRGLDGDGDCVSVAETRR